MLIFSGSIPVSKWGGNMKYAVIPADTYTSWVQLEAEAMRIVTALDQFTQSIVVTDEEPPANNVLYFDTGEQAD